MKPYSAPRRLVTLTLIGCLLFATAAFKACPKSEKDRNVALARDVLSGFQATQPLVDRLAPALSGSWSRATGRAAELISAVEASNETEIVAILADVMPVFTAAVAAFTGNEKVLAGLALADIALHWFANRVVKAHAVANQPGQRKQTLRALRSAHEPLAVIEQFNAQPSFGCQFKPEKCK